MKTTKKKIEKNKKRKSKKRKFKTVKFFVVFFFFFEKMTNVFLRKKSEINEFGSVGFSVKFTNVKGGSFNGWHHEVV